MTQPCLSKLTNFSTFQLLLTGWHKWLQTVCGVEAEGYYDADVAALALDYLLKLHFYIFIKLLLFRCTSAQSRANEVQ
jgi:hypothetical protein